MKYPVAKITVRDNTIYIRLYNHPEIERLTSAEIIERCKNYSAFKIAIEETHLHIIQLIHDLRQHGYKVLAIEPA